MDDFDVVVELAHEFVDVVEARAAVARHVGVNDAAARVARDLARELPRAQAVPSEVKRGRGRRRRAGFIENLQLTDRAHGLKAWVVGSKPYTSGSACSPVLARTGQWPCFGTQVASLDRR